MAVLWPGAHDSDRVVELLMGLCALERRCDLIHHAHVEPVHKLTEAGVTVMPIEVNYNLCALPISASVEDLRRELDRGVWRVPPRTPYFDGYKLSDRICFCVPKVGIVATASLASTPYRWQREDSDGGEESPREPDGFVVNVEAVRWFSDDPIVPTPDRVARLRGMEGIPFTEGLRWLMHGVTRLSEGDYLMLLDRAPDAHAHAPRLSPTDILS